MNAPKHLNSGGTHLLMVNVSAMGREPCFVKHKSIEHEPSCCGRLRLMVPLGNRMVKSTAISTFPQTPANMRPRRVPYAYGSFSIAEIARGTHELSLLSHVHILETRLR